MTTIDIPTSHHYPVEIASGLLQQAGERIRALFPGVRAAVVTDTNVAPLYLAPLIQSLNEAGIASVSYCFPAGEQSKTAATYVALLEFLAEQKLTRSDILIALGGGVVGDLTGFAAATYLRGISLVQVPTTLLAAVDSSVGGKTAIDLKAGKNLAGAFYQPNAVICDTDTLDTLPAQILRDGCAEVLKYGVLYDGELLRHMTQNGLSFDREWVICRCVAHKNRAVSQDEFDTGVRQMLNLGHTFGHGVEGCSKYTVSHGKAVAIGMAMIARSSAALGHCTRETCNSILEALEALQLPITTPYTAAELLRFVLSDKKRSADTINLILPQKIGQCIIAPTPVEAIESIMEAGM